MKYMDMLGYPWPQACMIFSVKNNCHECTCQSLCILYVSELMCFFFTGKLGPALPVSSNRSSDVFIHVSFTIPPFFTEILNNWRKITFTKVFGAATPTLKLPAYNTSSEMHNALVKVSKGQATGGQQRNAALKLPGNTKMAGSWEDLCLWVLYLWCTCIYTYISL